MVEHVEVDVSAGSQEKLQLQSECQGHESAVHPQRRDRGTITSVCVGRVILQLLPDVSNPRLPKCRLRLLRLEITELDSSQQLKRTGKEMQRKKPVTRLLLWLNLWAALLRVVIVIVSFGLTLTKEWGKKKKKATPKPLFFFLIACVRRQRLSPGDSRVQRFAITSSQAVYSDCTCTLFHCCLQTMFPKSFLLLCSPLRHPNFLLSLPKLVFSSLPATSYPRSVPPTALQDKPFTVLTHLGRQAKLLPSFWGFVLFWPLPQPLAPHLKPHKSIPVLIPASLSMFIACQCPHAGFTILNFCFWQPGSCNHHNTQLLPSLASREVLEARYFWWYTW